MDEAIFYRVFCQTDLVVEHVLCHLEARDLCVFVHMVMPASNKMCNVKTWQDFYWLKRKDTACNDGVCFDRWFGGHTGLCQCRGPKDACALFACERRLMGLKADVSWHEHMAYNSLGPVEWAGPTHGTVGTHHTIVIYRQGMVGVLGGTVRHGWLMHPVHMPLTRVQHPGSVLGGLTGSRQMVTQCVPFIGDTQYVGVLCGRHMVVLRRSVSPQVCGTWYIASALMLARRVAVCSVTRMVFAACSTGVLFAQRYRDVAADLTSAHFVSVDRGNEVLGNRSVALVAVLQPGVVLVRDYASPGTLKAVRVDHTKVPYAGKVVAQLVMDAACFVQQLVTLRYSRGVGVVCHRRDDVGVMSLWAVTTKRALDDGVRLVARCVQPWHRCPDGRVIDVAGVDREPWLAAGGGNVWRTGSCGVLMVQSGDKPASARRVCWQG